MANNNVPNHIAIIMDGNRRWAKERHLPSIEGHLRGYELLKKMPEWFFSQGVKTLSVFAFSSENWNRSRDEVNYLMKLAERMFRHDFEEFSKRGYKLLISGRIDELPGDLPAICRDVMDKTAAATGGVLHICFNYGGRAEIVDAVKKMVENKIDASQVHEGMIRKHFYNEEIPDPDMVVRTSGEQRLSGFLLWQSAYSELYFMDKFWPDFEKRDAEMILDEYAKRQRRFGGG